jgi:4-hydroxybenzoate polyprenyltransferase
MRGAVTQADAGATQALPVSSWSRLLACIRFDEVAVLQGAPLLGACFAMREFSVDALLTVAMLMAGNACLVAHVFVLNDWAGIAGDLKDPNRATRTFLARGASRAEAGWLALALLALALLLFGLMGVAPMVLAGGIAALSALYSAPGLNGKGRPVLSSVLHLAGGTAHFLLGFACLAPMSWEGAAIGAYFGLVFAAGHLTHEARDHDADRLVGIRTNAVAFGRKLGVLASLGLFTLAYALLSGSALAGLVPMALVFVALLYPLHLLATLRALRDGPDYRSLTRLQNRYRRIHAVIGLAMLATALPW